MRPRLRVIFPHFGSVFFSLGSQSEDIVRVVYRLENSILEFYDGSSILLSIDQTL